MTKIKKRMNQRKFMSIKRELIADNSKMRMTMLNTLISMETYSTNVEKMLTIDRDSENRANDMQDIYDLKRAMPEIKKRVEELHDKMGNIVLRQKNMFLEDDEEEEED